MPDSVQLETRSCETDVLQVMCTQIPLYAARCCLTLEMTGQSNAGWVGHSLFSVARPLSSLASEWKTVKCMRVYGHFPL